MPTKKGRPSEGRPEENTQINDTTAFLDVPVTADGKRPKEQLTPEALGRIVERESRVVSRT